MRLKFKWIYTLLLAFLVQFSFAQEKTVTGIVTDSNGPLPGVNVVIKGTKRGVTTGFDGSYSIKAKVGEVLLFSFVGYEEINQTVTNKNLINVKLQENTQVIEEVVVVAYGNVKKTSFTGSATKVNAESFQQRAVTNVAAVIEGASPGVQIRTSSGQPGASASFTIRGFSSFNLSNDPLYVVDGVIYVNGIENLNQNDIESVSILKDASSTALYGAKAANGVVLITTKKGKSEKAKYNFSTTQGISNMAIKDYARVDAKQYYPILWEARRNELLYGNPTNPNANQLATNQIYGLLGYNPFNVPNNQIVDINGNLNPNAELKYNDLDWQKEILRPGTRNTYDFSYSGKNDKNDYFVSIGYLKEEGYVINSDFKRLNARLNINNKVTNWFKTGLNLSANMSESNQAVDGVANSSAFVNPFRSTRLMGPIYPVFLHDANTGAFILDENGNKIYDSGNTSSTLTRPAGASPGRHAIQENLLNIDKDYTTFFSGKTYGEVSFLKGFKFTFNASLDKEFNYNESFTNKIIGDAIGSGAGTRTNDIITTQNYNQLLDYTKNFGNHNVSVLLGHESFELQTERLSGSRRNVIIDDNTELINFTETSDLFSRRRNYNTEGYFSRLNYDFKELIFLSGSYRRDGTSRFDNKWGDFYGLSGALNIQKLLKNVSWIEELRLRSSIGTVGNDGGISFTSLSYYASKPLLSFNNNGIEAGYISYSVGGSDLQWEKNEQIDYAIEFGLFKNRLKGSVEYYKRKTDGLLFEVPLPLSAGLDNKLTNVGTLENRGVEVQLSADIIKNKNLNWNVTFNVATLENEVLKLVQAEVISGTKKLMVGTSINDYWLRQWHGVDPTDGAGLFIAADNATAGTDIRTIDGVRYTTSATKAKFDYSGTSLPDYYGSIGTTLKFKNFQFNSLMTYQVGGKIYDSNFAALMDPLYGNALSTEILDRWQKPGDIATNPRVDSNGTFRTNTNAASTRWLIDASYISIRQIGLSYDFPKSLTKKLVLDNVKVFSNVENAFTWSKRQGTDVGSTFSGTTQNRYTPARIFTFGLNVSF